MLMYNSYSIKIGYRKAASTIAGTVTGKAVWLIIMAMLFAFELSISTFAAEKPGSDKWGL